MAVLLSGVCRSIWFESTKEDDGRGSLCETRTRLARFCKERGEPRLGRRRLPRFWRLPQADAGARVMPLKSSACVVALIPRLGQIAFVFTVVAETADHGVRQSPAPVSLEMQEQMDRVCDVVAGRQVDRQADDSSIDKPIDKAAARDLADHHSDRAREGATPGGCRTTAGTSGLGRSTGGRSLPRLPSRSRDPLGRLGTRNAARGATYAPGIRRWRTNRYPARYPARCSASSGRGSEPLGTTLNRPSPHVIDASEQRVRMAQALLHEFDRRRSGSSEEDGTSGAAAWSPSMHQR